MISIKHLSILSLIVLSDVSRSIASNHNDQFPRKRLIQVKTVSNDVTNQVHMSVINEKYLEYQSDQDGFVSVTMEFRLAPVTDEMQELQKLVFEKSIVHFLKTVSGSQTKNDINILAATVTNSKGVSRVDDHNENSESANDTLSILVVISAQENDTKSFLNANKFGEMLFNLCSIYKYELIQGLKDEESGMLSEVTAYRKIFHSVETVDVSLHESDGGGSMTSTGYIVLACFLTIVLIFVAAALFSHFRRR